MEAIMLLVEEVLVAQVEAAQVGCKPQVQLEPQTQVVGVVGVVVALQDLMSQEEQAAPVSSS